MHIQQTCFFVHSVVSATTDRLTVIGIDPSKPLTGASGFGSVRRYPSIQRSEFDVLGIERCADGCWLQVIERCFGVRDVEQEALFVSSDVDGFKKLQEGA